MARIPEKLAGVDVTALAVSAREAYLLMLVDGAASEEDIAAACGMPVADVVAVLERLAQQGAVRFQAPAKVPVGQMSISRISLGEGHQGVSVEDPSEHLAHARTAKAQGDVAAAREHANLAWMAAPSSAEVAALKAELDEMERASAAVAPAPLPPVTSRAPELAVPDASICKNPSARSLLLQAGKKVAGGDYAGAARDLQTASIMEPANTRLARFRDDVNRARKASGG